MGLLFTSFLAGLLTVLSPCVLPLLPIIIGGSVSDQKKSRPYIIILSLGLSIIAFTLLLKTSVLFFTIPNVNFPIVNTSVPLTQVVSGLIILILGIFTVFPNLYEKIILKLNISNSSQGFLANANKKKGTIGAILVGVALGPVFASCSLTYALILATVLPANFFEGLLYLISYVLGISIFMLLISIFGQKLVSKFRWAVNPTGLFRKILGVIFIIISIIILLGFDKTIQTFFAEHGYLDATKLEQGFYNKDSSKVFNVDKPYAAPEFVGINTWINSDPLTYASLKGKVVVIDVWTYSCINCIRSTPHVVDWYTKYKDQGLVVIGLHAPEFDFEKDSNNVKKAVDQYGIKYPVAMDNNKKTWNALKNTAWPSTYFIDKDGNIRHTHVGEGDYNQSELVIRELLKETGNMNLGSIGIPNEQTIVPVSSMQSPETYLGYSRIDRTGNFANKKDQTNDIDHKYVSSSTLLPSQWSLGGTWNLNEEYSLSKANDATLKYNFSGKEVYLVMGSDTQNNVMVKLDGKVIDQNLKGVDVDSKGSIAIKDYKLYKIVKSDKFLQNSILELSFPNGIKINAFTFGS